MSEEITGSVLEQVVKDQTPTSQETQTEPETNIESPAEEVEAPKSSVPEEYKDYTPDDWYKAVRDTKANLGRKEKEVEEYIQETYQLRSELQKNSTPPNITNQTSFDVNSQSPHLPGAQGLDNGLNSTVDINKLLDEDPGRAIIEAVKLGSHETLKTYEEQQRQRAEAGRNQRKRFIETEVVTELRKIKNEDPRLTDYVWRQMQQLDAEDEISAALESDPHLNATKIRKHVRELFTKATEGLMSDKEKALKEIGYDDEFIKKLKTLEKEAAANGAPPSKAANSVPPSPQPAQMSEAEMRYAFLPSVQQKYGLDN